MLSVYLIRHGETEWSLSGQHTGRTDLPLNARGEDQSRALEPDLAEWDYGDYDGLRSSDIHKQRPEWSVFRDGCPGGESPAQIADRADRLIARLRTHDGNIALFTHGHFGCVLAARWTDLPVIEGQHLLLSTASISMLGQHPTHPEVPVISLWNATVSD